MGGGRREGVKNFLGGQNSKRVIIRCCLSCRVRVLSLTFFTGSRVISRAVQHPTNLHLLTPQYAEHVTFHRILDGLVMLGSFDKTPSEIWLNSELSESLKKTI